MKLCLKNEQTGNKQICLVNHEGLEPNTGMVLVAVGILYRAVVVASGRTAPFGAPAEDALGRWLTEGRPAVVTSTSGPALLLGARGGRLDALALAVLDHEVETAGGAESLDRRRLEDGLDIAKVRARLPSRTRNASFGRCEPTRKSAYCRYAAAPLPKAARRSASSGSADLVSSKV